MGEKPGMQFWTHGCEQAPLTPKGQSSQQQKLSRGLERIFGARLLIGGILTGGTIGGTLEVA